MHINETNQGSGSLFTCDVTSGSDDLLQSPCLFTYGATPTAFILAWMCTFTLLYALMAGMEKTLVLSYRFDQHRSRVKEISCHCVCNGLHTIRTPLKMK
jgi:hypothetical protein